MTLTTKQQRGTARAEVAHEKPSANKLANSERKRSDVGLTAGAHRIIRSVYLDTILFDRLRDVAQRTNRSFQEVMREGLTLVVAKHGKGSARE